MFRVQQKKLKLSGEIRYTPTLSSWDETVNLGKIVEKGFEHWKIENKKDVTLYHTKKKFLIKIKYNSIIFLNEGDQESNDKLIEYVSKILSELLKNTEIQEFLHIGCRRMSITETDLGKKDLVDLTFSKFYGNQDLLKTFSGEEINDASFVLESEKDGFKNHIQIGPTQKNQALQLFSEFFTEDSLDDEKNYIFMDVDVYKQQGVSRENCLSILNDVMEKNKIMIDGYLNFLQE